MTAWVMKLVLKKAVKRRPKDWQPLTMLQHILQSISIYHMMYVETPTALTNFDSLPGCKLPME